MPQVEFRNLYKRYGKLSVMENLNLTVQAGEFLVLLGPSGCGKTTLLNMLAGLQEVTAGSIHIDGADVTDLDPKDRGLAMVFQSYALYPTKTVAGNLRFGLSARSLPATEVERRVAWAAELLQISALMDRRPAQLSGGQRQRVAIGRALVKQVGLYLFDEPLSNLDAKLRTEMRLEIKKLHDQLQSTVVYVTHDQIEAMTMATRIAVMDGGVIQQYGSPDEIYERPANLFVAGFIGSPAMNFLDAEATERGARLTGGVEIDLADYAWTNRPAPGARLRIGLRPEHFSLNSGGGNALFRLPVFSAERTGGDATIFLNGPAGPMAVRADPAAARGVTPGTEIAVGFPGEKANVFDRANGLRL